MRALAAALLVVTATAAADPPHARRAATPASAAPGASAPGAPGADPEDDDPLPRLAARLAERLGAHRVVDAEGTVVLRVPPRAAASASTPVLRGAGPRPDVAGAVPRP